MKRLLRALLIIMTLGSLLVGCVFTLLIREFTVPVNDQNIAQEFVVNEGDTPVVISTNLEDAGLVRRAFMFRMLTSVRNAGTGIQAGSYYFSPNMTMNQILNELLKPRGGEFETARFTLPEGLRLEEIAESVAEQTGVIDAEQFLELVQDGSAFQADYAFLEDLPSGASLEGFLFPDTYEIFMSASAEDVVRLMLDTFALRWENIEIAAQVSDRTPFEIVTMASIVQREASNDEEMPRIAAAFWNRLKPDFAGQQLGADPTVQYALGYSEDEQSWWRKELTNLDLAIDSPYNTRINSGLPPGPISAPGLIALQAAADPAAEDVTYFVAKCVPEGERPTHNFTNDYSEFLVFQEEFLSCSK